MKITSIVGARPNFVKLSPIEREIKRREIDYSCIHTGQHYDFNMNEIFFQDFQISTPDYNLGIKEGTHGYQTGYMLEGIDRLLTIEEPDLVIVVGDTNSTLAGALAARKLNIPVAHVEAGLRVYDLSIPEETNRIITDVCSTFLLCPTKQAVRNLENSADITGLIENVGNVAIDSIEQNRHLIPRWVASQPYCLVTCHHTAIVDSKPNLTKLVQVIREVSRIVHVIFPMHPRTRKNMEKFGLSQELCSQNVDVIEPLGYLAFQGLVDGAIAVLTDSGGLIVESCYRGIPCMTLPPSEFGNSTEWVETLNGNNILVDLDPVNVKEHLTAFLNKTEWGKKRLPNPYPEWDGNTSQRILDLIGSS